MKAFQRRNDKTLSLGVEARQLDPTKRRESLNRETTTRKLANDSFFLFFVRDPIRLCLTTSEPIFFLASMDSLWKIIALNKICRLPCKEMC